jgi:hypothetical protein
MSFDIILWGNVIGRMNVVHSLDKDSNDVFSIESKTKAKFLWIVRNGLSKFEAVYSRGKLLSSSHLEIENEKTKRWAKVKFDGKQYHITALEQTARSFTEAPVCSDANIYFSDYKSVKQIFYLPDAKVYEMKHTDSNTLEFKSDDGHRNVYLFENGKIKAMEFHLPVATIYMKKVG